MPITAPTSVKWGLDRVQIYMFVLPPLTIVYTVLYSHKARSVCTSVHTVNITWTFKH